MSALVVHEMAYLVLLGHPGGVTLDHSHLATQWGLVTPIAVVAAAAFIIGQLRQLGAGRSIDHRALAAITALAFTAQELTESVVQSGGLDAAFTNPAILIGLAFSPLVAWVVARVLREATDLLAGILPPTTPLLAPVAALVPLATSHRCPTTIVDRSTSERGPPSSVRV